MKLWRRLKFIEWKGRLLYYRLLNLARQQPVDVKERRHTSIRVGALGPVAEGRKINIAIDF